MTLLYCQKCWFPSSKPNIRFTADGVCYACLRAEIRATKNEADWVVRRKEFFEYVESVRDTHPLFDVVVPVSGGKDSTVQVVRMMELNLRILAINVDYGLKTELGRINLENIARIGNTTLLTIRPPLQSHIKLIAKGLEKFGDPDLFSHMLLHAAPIHFARVMNIPFIFLGENSADLYGGNEKIARQNELTEDWFKSYASIGFELSELIQEFNLEENLVRLYGLPRVGYDSFSKPKMFFMSNLWPWDSINHLEIATKRGFRASQSPTEGTFRNYVSLDEEINRVHQYLKLLKFGYGRSTDHANEEIRQGRLTRNEGRTLILKHELEPLNLDILERLANFLELDIDEMCKTIESFRNMNIWKHSSSSRADEKFYIPGFLELNSSHEQVITGFKRDRN